MTDKVEMLQKKHDLIEKDLYEAIEKYVTDPIACGNIQRMMQRYSNYAFLLGVETEKES